MKPRRYWLGRIVVGTLYKLATLLLKLETEGMERIPASGPVVLIGNHVNFVDTILLYPIFARRYIRPLTAIETYRRVLYSFVAWSVEAIPVRRGTPDRQAIRACVETLNAGLILYIAPEGTRSGHGRLQKGLAGMTLVLLRAGTHIPIYPVAFIGLERLWPNLGRLRRTPARMTVGQPFYLSPPQGHVTRAVRDEITDEMMGQIAAMLPPENRGVYADRVGQKPQYLRFVSGAT
jgi:1-acyl-sn-glycerol-3-phosphate acyltransferase